MKAGMTHNLTFGTDYNKTYSVYSSGLFFLTITYIHASFYVKVRHVMNHSLIPA
jgi:hypothetical protein